jgi:hypothetical protein
MAVLSVAAAAAPAALLLNIRLIAESAGKIETSL